MKRLLYLVGVAPMLLSGVLAANVMAAPSHAKKVTLQLCSSTPFGVPALKQLSQGIRNGEHLALIDMSKPLAAAGVKMLPPKDMDDAKSDGSSYSPDKEASNARTCTANAHTIGYIGTLNSGAALYSEPITNRAFMVQVSPANTFPGLTSVKPFQGSGGRKAQEPYTYSHKISSVTYYRTVTTDALQGPAGVIFAKSKLHVKSVFVIDDGLQYGVGLASSFKAAAKAKGLSVLGTGRVDSSSPAAEASTSNQLAQTVMSKKPNLVYCGCDSETIVPLPRALQKAGFRGTFMGGDALVNTTYIKNEGSASSNNYATSVGPDVSKQPKTFKGLYKRHFPAFFKNPGPQAYDATSFDATTAVLKAIVAAAKAHRLTGSITNMRKAVAMDVGKVNFQGATGLVAFDKNGDTLNRIISVYRVKGGSWKFVKQLKPTGYAPAP